MSIKTNARTQGKIGFIPSSGSLMDWIGSLGAEDIGVDLGSSNVVIYIKNKGLVLPESSVVAMRHNSSDFVAYGTQAEEMEGRTPQGIYTIRPIKESAIIDYKSTAYLLNSIINQSYLKRVFFHPRLIICVPVGITGVQRRALLEAAFTMGARKTVLIEQPIASLIGTGINIENMEGAMVVDVGGGTASVSVVSTHGVVVSDFSRQAGLAMDQAIISYVRDKYKVEIGRKTAEIMKISLGTMWYIKEEQQFLEVCGSSLVTGLPVKITVTGQDVAESLYPLLENIFHKVRNVLQKTPPALLGDIREHGIMISGGAGQLKGLDRMITNLTGIPSYVVEHPLYVNAIGAGTVLEHMNILRDALQDLR
ncbi:rod shape-determining protein [Dialister pneumosintes]|nr:rod shape-determining protein [Dialister pneumosintes]